MSRTPQREILSLLPRKRPWWALVILVMLTFGYYQALLKLALNQYLMVLIEHPELKAMNPEGRATSWSEYVPPKVENGYEFHEPWELFHHIPFHVLWVGKWILAFSIVGVFFSLDAWFLRVTGRWMLRGALLGVYGFVGFIMTIFLFLMPGQGGYDVASQLLMFLQSPLPSFMLVFVHWMQKRTHEGAL